MLAIGVAILLSVLSALLASQNKNAVRPVLFEKRIGCPLGFLKPGSGAR
jgi:uncharacterized integral membrane protein